MWLQLCSSAAAWVECKGLKSQYVSIQQKPNKTSSMIMVSKPSIPRLMFLLFESPYSVSSVNYSSALKGTPPMRLRKGGLKTCWNPDPKVWTTKSNPPTSRLGPTSFSSIDQFVFNALLFGRISILLFLATALFSKNKIKSGLLISEKSS